MTSEITVGIIAGEPSGDLLGANLMRDIKSLQKDPKFIGVGGDQMQSEGLVSLFPMEELSVMGLAEVLPRIPRFLKRIKQTVESLKKATPDVIVTIDSPDFCFRVASKLQGSRIPLVHYVAPSVWAWRPKRAEKLSKLYDHVLALLPFEPPYFEAVGLNCTFVGHPATTRSPLHSACAADTQKSSLIIGLLPGSREGEVKRHLPIFCETVNTIIHHGRESVRVVIPTLTALQSLVTAYMKNQSFEFDIICGLDEKQASFSRMDIALAASGTVALELAIARVPAVIAYKVNPLTAWIARRLINVSFISLVNIVENKEVTPECLQENCSPEVLSSKLFAIINSEEIRNQQLEAYERVENKLSPPHTDTGSLAALTVLNTMKAKKPGDTA